MCLAAASLQLVAAPTASANELQVQIQKLTDGTAPFEDWCNDGSDGVDVPCVAGNNVQEPGDDLNANNGFVRTGDSVQYSVDYSFNPPFTGGDNLLTVSLSNGALVEKSFAMSTDPVSGICKGGLTFLTPRTGFTCNLGPLTVATTGTVQMPAFIPVSMGDGISFTATASVTNLGSATSSQTSAPVTTSAAPRWDLIKDIPVQPTFAAATETLPAGYDVLYTIGLRAADADTRGNSALTSPVTTSDIFTTSSTMVESCSIVNSSLFNAPQVASAATLNWDYQVRDANATCVQANPGAPITLTFSPDFDRPAAPPTKDVYGQNLTAGHLGYYALAQVLLRVPATDVDAATAPAGDGIGTMYFGNAVGTTTAGTCTTPNPGSPWLAGSGVNNWDPADTGGKSNFGNGAESTLNNGVCTQLDLRVNGRYYKTETRGLGVALGSKFQSRIGLINQGGADYPAGVQLCDKWENDKFTLARPSGSSSNVFGVPFSSNPLQFQNNVSYNGTYVAEYGIGPWGTHRTVATDSEEYKSQSSNDCSAPAPMPGDADGWVTAADVDFTNSGLGVVNAKDLNMSRITLLQPVPPGKNAGFTFVWEPLTGPNGQQMRNYAAFSDTVGGPTLTPCTNYPDCTVPLAYTTSAGFNSSWWTLIRGAVFVGKSNDDGAGTTYGVGDNVPWTVTVQSQPAESSGYLFEDGAGAGSTSDVTATDTLPLGFTYVPGSAKFQTPLSYPAAPATAEPTLAFDATGHQTMTWKLGDMPWTKRAVISYKAQIGGAVATGSYTNYVSVNSPDRAGLPIQTPDEIGGYSNNYTLSANTVDVNGSNQAVISKAALTPLLDAGDVATYKLDFANNSATDLNSFDAIDILPYAGDTRGSVVTPGSLTLKNITPSSKGEVAWVSTTAPGALDALDGATLDGRVDPASAAALGSTQWPCTFAAVAASTCPGVTLSAVTALRFVGNSTNPAFLPAKSGNFSILLNFQTTAAAKPGDIYKNSWEARFGDIALPVFFSAQIQPQIRQVAIGDFVFLDTNYNGVADAGEPGVPGVAVQIYAAGKVPGTDSPAGSAITGSDGRWFVKGLAPGSYFVFLPSINFANGGPLAGKKAAPAGVADPSNGSDEGKDHQATGVNPALNGVKSGVVSLLTGGSPLGQTSPNKTDLPDRDVNLTVDFGFVGASSITIDKTVGATGGPYSDSYSVGLSGLVQWKLVVTNSGQQTLTSIKLTDATLQACVVAQVIPAALDPGASFTFLCPESISAGYVNTATVTAIDLEKNTVTDDDPAQVTVTPPTTTPPTTTPPTTTPPTTTPPTTTPPTTSTQTPTSSTTPSPPMSASTTSPTSSTAPKLDGGGNNTSSLAVAGGAANGKPPAPTKYLPETGSHTDTLLPWALLLMGLGAGTLLVARRRA
ncbi:LPXTG cell wall anchor domain-containing protein [Nakamurella antarctica]|uniref:LPXTG cell wall anchor domain-containing protein n=1 Tax=Nakamurella antarctica TaxID=1902245 RepID=A0A3G8ZJJ0_9ACTN|nr:SdrD B-like domain-containing protein [Nakamurella antarctica]AZI56937.1 LPXTG cell wall anchor domain-containing protein [Nakamurella antarctica]